jgi:hypothetical protein
LNILDIVFSYVDTRLEISNLDWCHPASASISWLLHRTSSFSLPDIICMKYEWTIGNKPGTWRSSFNHKQWQCVVQMQWHGDINGDINVTKVPPSTTTLPMYTISPISNIVGNSQLNYQCHQRINMLWSQIL